MLLRLRGLRRPFWPCLPTDRQPSFADKAKYDFKFLLARRNCRTRNPAISQSDDQIRVSMRSDSGVWICKRKQILTSLCLNNSELIKDAAAQPGYTNPDLTNIAKLVHSARNTSDILQGRHSHHTSHDVHMIEVMLHVKPKNSESKLKGRLSPRKPR